MLYHNFVQQINYNPFNIEEVSLSCDNFLNCISNFPKEFQFFFTSTKENVEPGIERSTNRIEWIRDRIAVLNMQTLEQSTKFLKCTTIV